MVLIDPKLNSLIFVKNEGAWSFSQGGLYNSDVYDTVEDVLERELNLNPKIIVFFTQSLLARLI